MWYISKTPSAYTRTGLSDYSAFFGVEADFLTWTGELADFAGEFNLADLATEFD